MLWFILGIILLLVAVGFFVFGGNLKKTDEHACSKVSGRIDFWRDS